MKKSVLIILVLFIATFFQYCRVLSKEESMLLKLKETLPKELTTDIPDLNSGKIINIKIVYPDGCYADNWCGIHLLMKMQDEDFNKYVDFLKKNKEVVYTFNDTCMFFINKNKLDNSLGISMCDTSTSNLFLPISNFNYCYEALPEKPFYKESQVYVISAKKGTFMEKENLTKGVGLSKEWKNGYSKGALVNENRKIVYFWLEVW